MLVAQICHFGGLQTFHRDRVTLCTGSTSLSIARAGSDLIHAALSLSIPLGPEGRRKMREMIDTQIKIDAEGFAFLREKQYPFKESGLL